MPGRDQILVARDRIRFPSQSRSGPVFARRGLMLGSTVSHYRIEELIGEGGMGVVYRAHDLTLNRAVAVKFLSLMAADGDRRRRFQFEAEAASSLNHPHILSVFEVGTHDGKPYLVTEFVHGSTLREWVRQVTPSVRQLLETLVPVAEA